MKLKVTFRHMESDGAIQEYLERRLLPVIEKYHQNPVSIQTSFEWHGKFIDVKCGVFSSVDANYQVHASGRNFYTCIDQLTEKLDKKMRRAKDKHLMFRKRGFEKINQQVAQQFAEQFAVQ
jgi:ribosomal subunit interface protein